MHIHNPLPAFLSTLLFHLSNLYQSVNKSIRSAFRDEIKVWKKSDWHGNTWWQVYDPLTNRSASLGSELEVMMWIEQNYYKK